ncbi:MAG: MlaE family lipid ABC transporter permease subunit [Acidobacteria bacterium]|nr:MAG: MlaE family lipid ABC transporter permease subunit [Acidobacteriota bacterium]
MSAEDTAQLTIAKGRAATDAGVEARCVGAWTVHGISDLAGRLDAQSWPEEGNLVIDGSAISALDTSGAWLLHRTVRRLGKKGRQVRVEGLRPEFSSLLQLVASREVFQQVPAAAPPSMLARLGKQAWSGLLGTVGFLSFVGESFTVLLRSLVQPHRLRWRPILHNIQIAGYEALPITGLLSFLMGIVIAYQGADQLQRFGANIFIVDLVGLAMLRELSPLLTAIIIAGRSGSAYTAQIGTMKVTEEIDALRTIGVAPQELLVLPKLVALIIALPLLTVYTDVTGILGGMIMARSKLGVSFDVFLDRLDEAIQLSSYWTGISKAPVFATIIALVGCYRGFHVSGSAESVGKQTTLSVVQSIFLVIATDAVFSIVFNWLDL